MGEMVGSTSPGPDHRRPYWVVGLALLALVVGVLAFAFFLNQHLGSRAGVAPLSTGTPTKGSTRPAQQKGHPTATTAATAVATATPASTPLPITPLTPRQQVEQAYHRYWQDYSHALFTLDTSHMGDVATGTELKRVQAEVAALQQRNRAVHVSVSHSALVVSIKGDKATVYDEQHDRSFLINPITKEPHNGSVQPFLEKDIYSMQKIHGTWKVVKSLRQR